MTTKKTTTKISCKLVWKMSNDGGCSVCPCLRWDRAGDFRYCVMTGECLEWWRDTRGMDCPIIIQRVIEEEE